MSKPLSRGKFLQLTIIGIVGFFVVWYAARFLHLSPPKFLPMPHEVAAKFFALFFEPFAGATLDEHMLASLRRFGMGFGLAALVGVPLGLAMGWFRWLDDAVTPIFDSLRFIAPVAWVPFAALWFGTGIGGPTLIIFVGAFPPCLINAYRGARNVDNVYLEAASVLGIGHLRMITDVLFPAAVPSIIAGLRIAAGLGWMSLVGAELIVASSGMGNLIVRAQSAIETSTVMAGMIAIGLVGIVIDVLIRRMERQLLKHRRG